MAHTQDSNHQQPSGFVIQSQHEQEGTGGVRVEGDGRQAGAKSQPGRFDAACEKMSADFAGRLLSIACETPSHAKTIGETLIVKRPPRFFGRPK